MRKDQRLLSPLEFQSEKQLQEVDLGWGGEDEAINARWEFAPVAAEEESSQVLKERGAEVSGDCLLQNLRKTGRRSILSSS